MQERDDPHTWGDDRWPTAVHGAILPGHGIGQSAAQWFIRGSSRVQAAFEGVWQTSDLLTSFDGMSLWRPWAVNGDWKTNAGASWLHVDQHPITRPGFHCVQSVVNLLPTSPSTGGVRALNPFGCAPVNRSPARAARPEFGDPKIPPLLRPDPDAVRVPPREDPEDG